MPSGATPEEIVRLALEAVSDRDPDRLQPLLAAGVSIQTDRSTHAGADAALAWARKGYDHLDRRLLLERLEPPVASGRMLGHGRVEYVWRENGEVADAKAIFFVIELADDLLHRLELHEGLPEAQAALNA